MFGNYLTNVRTLAPLIHNITNYVTINDVANILLACGSRPIMSDCPIDIEEITSVSDGLNLNLGMLNPGKLESMLLAGKKARRAGHAIVLDPVGVGSSTFRLNAAHQLIKEVQPDAIRGNLSEIRTIALKASPSNEMPLPHAEHELQNTFENKRNNGVDADRTDVINIKNMDRIAEFVTQTAKHFRCIVAVTGTIDVVSDGSECFLIRNGHEEMSSVTGTGCQLSALMTAFLAANPDEKLKAAAAAACAMGLAGEIAWEHMTSIDGNATYRNRIIDAIYRMNKDTLDQGAVFKILSF